MNKECKQCYLEYLMKEYKICFITDIITLVFCTFLIYISKNQVIPKNILYLTNILVMGFLSIDSIRKYIKYNKIYKESDE